MKLFCKAVCTLLCLMLIVCSVGLAKGATDVDNHMDCDNKNYVIPKGDPVRLDASSGWIRNQKNLITNFYSMYQPEVVYVSEWDVAGGYPYIMWFFAWSYNQENDLNYGKQYEGFPGGDAIFCARAKTLEGPWEVFSNKGNKINAADEFYWDTQMDPFYWYPVIYCGDTWFNSWHIGDPSVVYHEGTFYMAMSSMGCDADMIPAHKQGDTDGNSSCIIGATSTDGIHWTFSQKPLVAWKNEKGHNEETDSGSYEGGHQRPSIMLEDGKWKMWYDFKGNQIGYAECDGDFMTGTWKEHKTGSTGLLTSVDFDVVKIGDIYYAYGDPYVSWEGIKDWDIPYYGNDGAMWSQRQIVEYQSYDGINWKCTGYFLPDTGYDANQIPQVFLDHKTDRVYIFYATQRGMREGGAGGAYDWRWDNIRCMYRDVNLFAKGGDTQSTTPTVKPTPTATPTQRPTKTEKPTVTTSPSVDITVEVTSTDQPTGTITDVPTATVTEQSTQITTVQPTDDGAETATKAPQQTDAPTEQKNSPSLVILIASAIAAVILVGAALIAKKRK